MRNHHNILGFVLLSLAAVMGVVGSGAGAEAQSPDPGAIQRTGGEAVGASVAHPAKWNVQREPYTFDKTYGYTLWYPDTDEAHDHGGRPALRVALDPSLRPAQIEGEVRETAAELPDLNVRRETVSVAQKGYRGIAVGPIPGSTPYTEIYVPVNGRVYRIDAYLDDPEREGLGAGAKELLSTIKFSSPSRSVASLDLPAANAQGVLYRGDQDLVEREQAAREEAAGGAPFRATAATKSGVPVQGERQISEGCWRANTAFFFQTQHGKYANKRWGARWTGWTIMGRPNYWGQYTHGNLNYGRCSSTHYTNDKFAVDYPLARGDAVFSPFRRGTVTFAGRNRSHANYGIFVVIRAANGSKYVSMSAHLNGLASGIKRGKVVTNNTVIGFAGDTGDPSIPVGEPHLHQAYYRYPRYLQDGSPYGGKGLQVIYHRYYGTAARKAGYTVSSRAYKFGAVRPNYKATCHERVTCGEGFRISN